MRKSESKRIQGKYPISVKVRSVDWTQDKATEKQILYIKTIQEAAKKAHRYLPFIDYRTATKLQASEYIEKYRKPQTAWIY